MANSAVRTISFPFTAEILILHTAVGTGLAAGIPLDGLHDPSTVPAGLVLDLVQQAGHSGVGQRPGLQTSFYHAGDVQGLDTQGVVLAHQGTADVVVRVVAQACYPAVGVVDAALGFPPTAASGRAARMLPTPQLALGGVVSPGVLVLDSVAVHGKWADAQVHATHGLDFSLGRRHWRFPAGDAGVPASITAADGDLVGDAFRQWAGNPHAAQAGPA